MEILKKKKVILENDVAIRKNPDSCSVVYLASDKVAQLRLVDKNRREKEESKKETANKKA